LSAESVLGPVEESEEENGADSNSVTDCVADTRSGSKTCLIETEPLKRDETINEPVTSGNDSLAGPD
jgi:hypothetical protein